ncbi:unnamed protein product [Symbiodinium natans]|uniref:Uncharacterized protein n=1 Tax=Symbiodinium natans TaxID=878477 RepID=A0A812UNY1_9DINO|nr:unnamed protein product [Symbiodinium natans]
MENHRDDRCRGVEEDGSDEVWPAAVIPDGLESEIDPGARSLDVCIFAAAVFAPHFVSATQCSWSATALSALGVVLLQDPMPLSMQGLHTRLTLVIIERRRDCSKASKDAIARGDQYNRWLWALQEKHAAIVVIECGGGLAIPSVRVQGEDAVDGAGKGSRLIRINPTHCKVPPTTGIGIPMGSMEGSSEAISKAAQSAHQVSGKAPPMAGCLLRCQACPKGSAMQWPVTVVELAATDPRPQAFLLLQRRSVLQSGEFQDALLSWAAELRGAERQQRIRDAAAWLQPERVKTSGNASRLYQSDQQKVAETLLERLLLQPDSPSDTGDDVVEEAPGKSVNDTFALAEQRLGKPRACLTWIRSLTASQNAQCAYAEAGDTGETEGAVCALRVSPSLTGRNQEVLTEQMTTSSIDTRPPFSWPQVELVAQRFGDFQLEKSLPSERDLNFLLRPAQIAEGERVVFKVHNPEDSRDFVECQCLALEHAAERGASCQRLLRSQDTREALLSLDLPGGKGTCFCRALSFLPGQMLADAAQAADSAKLGSLFAAVGEAVGSVTAALLEFNHAAATREFVWDLQRCFQVVESHVVDVKEEQRDLVQRVLEAQRLQLTSLLPKLRRMRIHCPQ